MSHKHVLSVIHGTAAAPLAHTLCPWVSASTASHMFNLVLGGTISGNIWSPASFYLSSLSNDRILQVSWTPKHVVIYPAICSFAGLVAGMFGVGGGIIKARLSLPAHPCPFQDMMHFGGLYCQLAVIVRSRKLSQFHWDSTSFPAIKSKEALTNL